MFLAPGEDGNIEFDPTTRTIGEAPQVRVPFIPPEFQHSYGNHTKSTIGNTILACKPIHIVPFTPGFGRDTATASPLPGPSTASAVVTAVLPSAPIPEKVTYIIHTRCHEIFKLVCAREDIPWELLGGDVQHVASDEDNYVSQTSFAGLTFGLGVLAAPAEGTPGTSLFTAAMDSRRISTSSEDTNTATTATTDRMPSLNYWSEKFCEYDFEVDLLGLADSMDTYCSSHVFGGIAGLPHTTPHFRVVSRDMWGLLGLYVDRDEFCPGIDDTGAAIVAVADPMKKIPCLRELLKYLSPAHYSGGGSTHNRSTSTSTAASSSTIPTNYSTLGLPTQSHFTRFLSRSRSLPLITRINPNGPSTATDPFSILPSELLLQILTYLSLPRISSLRLSSRYLASFIHPTSELPKSYFQDAFRPGGEFEFLWGLSVLTTRSGVVPERVFDFTVILEGEEQGQEVDWRGLYRKVQYFLEADPEGAEREFWKRYYLPGRELRNVVVPRSPELANRRRIWSVARRVVKEMKRVMEMWSVNEVGKAGLKKRTWG
ncbi:hypothetical protein EV426DRAFT_707558 [Tirmania nivea]|nr:hypothetical protein EV426DRAFT_707558 [Tirmania nivea]